MAARLLAAIAVSGVVSFILLSNGPAKSGARESSPCGPVERWPRALGERRTRELVLCLLNAERARAGLPALRRDPRLELAAKRHSQDMVERRFFEHDSPDGVDPQQRMYAAGYPSNNALSGENIAWAAGPAASPEGIVRLWMHSPPHREDILRPGFVDVGVGVAPGAPKESRSNDAAATFTTDFGGPPQR